jgi:hypothetical protein
MPLNQFKTEETTEMLNEEKPLPASSQEARDIALSMVGLVKPRVFFCKRSQWWDRLAAAQKPEEKLACQWMIDALGFALGLNEHERGALLARENSIKSEQETERESSSRDLARWD